MEKLNIKKTRDKIELTFVSRSFLQNQVRSMVGCLKKLGEKKWSLRKFKLVLYSKKRSNCAPPAPSYGLYLYNIKY
jgi:tRNA pseudouridine38-40 synthase